LVLGKTVKIKSYQPSTFGFDLFKLVSVKAVRSLYSIFTLMEVEREFLVLIIVELENLKSFVVKS